MPGPTTEVLSDDLKEMTSELHRIEVRSTSSFGEVRTDIGKLAAEFGLFKWLAGGLLGASLAASVGGLVSSSYWAGIQAGRITALESRSDRTDARLDRIEGGIGSINGRLDRIETAVGAMVPRLGRTEESVGAINTRLERIEASLTKAFGPRVGPGGGPPSGNP